MSATGRYASSSGNGIYTLIDREVTFERGSLQKIFEENDSRVVPQDPYALMVFLHPHLPDGAYTVVFRNVSTEDGHHVQSNFSFVVGSGPLPGNANALLNNATAFDENFTVWSIVLRWVNYLGMAALVGGAVLNSHAAASKEAWLLVPADEIHLLSTGGFWVGGLLTLVSGIAAFWQVLLPGTGERTRLLAILIPLIYILESSKTEISTRQFTAAPGWMNLHLRMPHRDFSLLKSGFLLRKIGIPPRANYLLSFCLRGNELLAALFIPPGKNSLFFLDTPSLSCLH